MPSIRIHSYDGMVPKNSRALQKGNVATLAENVDLGAGTLMGLREPLVVAPDGAPNKTIHETDAGWLRFPGVVDVVDGLPGCPRIIVAGEGIPYPQWATTGDAVAGEYVRLGLPVPGPVSASGGKATFSISHAGKTPATTITTPATTVTTPSGTWHNGGGAWGGSTVTINGATFDETLGESPVEWRSYVITYKDSFGNEGAPSLPSERIAIDDGEAVTLTLPATPATPWDVASICIYRASGGHEMNDKEMVADDFLLVAEVSAGTSSFTDALPNLEIDAEPLVGYDYTPAPGYLQHMAAEPNGTVLAGAAGREVWFCEPHEFQAWPEKYTLTLDDDIVGLCWTESGLYAMTDGPPYWIAPKVDEFGFRDVFRFPETLPCASRRSICKTAEGAVVYAHKDGLVLLSGKSARMETLGLWGESGFQQLDPASMVAEVYNGVWYGFTPEQGWMFSLKTVGVHSGSDQPVVTLTLRPTALHKSRGDRFFLALPEGISEWEQGANILPWRWLGRLNVSPAQMNMAAFKTVFEKHPHEYRASPWPIHIAFVTDDRTLYERDVDHSRPARLPHGWRHLGFEVDVKGYGGEPWRQAVEIREIHMASSLAELSEAGAAH